MAKRFFSFASKAPNFRTSWKPRWGEFPGKKRKYFRSRWEYNIACYFEYLKKAGEIIEWDHETDTFWFEGIKRGTNSYLPDFKVTYKDERIEYVEVKGMMDDKSKTKIKRMAKYHPNVKLVVLDEVWYMQREKHLKKIIPGWEDK